MNFISIFICLCFLRLLSDAKLREDVGEDVVGDDGADAGDGREGADDGSDFLGEEVGRESGLEPEEGAVESG